MRKDMYGLMSLALVGSGMVVVGILDVVRVCG